MNQARSTRWIEILLGALPLMIACAIWFTPLSFVPVPWPDDSAFYFVGRDFFRWPPRWVMLPQAPFEPSYRIYYPILMGLGRFLGIDGSFAIKFWPLSAFGLTGSWLAIRLFRAGLPGLLCALASICLMLDPGARWGAVIVRPESLIGLIGIVLVLDIALGTSERFKPRGLWDPIAACLALGAYAHFNAVHLLFAVVAALFFSPRRIVAIALRTALYLTPWVLTVLWHFDLFVRQFRTQWTRLAVGNSWLDTVENAIKGIYQEMGSPDNWPKFLYGAPSEAIWLWILAAGVVLIAGLLHAARKKSQPAPESPLGTLLPAAGWVLGSVWLWESKPEVWFTYYIHVTVWVFAGLSLLVLYRARAHLAAKACLAAAVASLLYLTVSFGYIDVIQARNLYQAPSWRWSVYHDFVNCVDQELAALEARLGYPKPFRVWCPTFPDITIELARKHPDWELTRTNDFHERKALALQHGRDVEAVVVTESINWSSGNLQGRAEDFPHVQSTWMLWRDYFLNELWREPGWKPRRMICQRERWQAFIFEN